MTNGLLGTGAAKFILFYFIHFVGGEEEDAFLHPAIAAGSAPPLPKHLE